MNKQTCRMVLAEARKLSGALQEIENQIREEAEKACRCKSEQEKEEDPCSPCIARKAVNGG